MNEVHTKHRWTSATSEETLSFSSDLHTDVWYSHLGSSAQDQGMSTENRISQPAQRTVANLSPKVIKIHVLREYLRYKFFLSPFR